MSARHRDQRPADTGSQATGLRLSLAAIFVGSAVLVGIAGVVERQPAQVNLTLSASEISFRTHQDLTISDVRVGALQLSRVGSLEFDVARAYGVQRRRETDQPAGWIPLPLRGAVVVRAAEPNHSMVARLRGEGMALSLGVDPQSEVRVAAAQSGARMVRVELIGGKARVDLDVGDTLELQCDHCVAISGGSKRSTFSDIVRLDLVRRQLRIELAGAGAILAMEQPSASAAESAGLAMERLAVNELRFQRLVGDRVESTLVEDGRLSFTGAKTPPETIRRGDFLRIECRGPAFLRTLEVGTRVTLDVDCDATVLRTASGGIVVSRLPSYLEWWYSNSTITLFVTAFLSIGSTVLIVLQRLGYLPKL